MLQLAVGGRRGRTVPCSIPRTPSGPSKTRTGGELLHVESAVDLKLQGGGDSLHANDAAEAREGVSEVRVHLAVLDKLLLTVQGHLTDSTGSCVQAFTVSHLS